MKQWKSLTLSALPWVLLGISALWAVLLRTPITVDALDMFTSDGHTFRSIVPIQLWFYLAAACVLASFSGAMLIQVSQCRSLDSTIPYWHAFRVTLQMLLLQVFIVAVCLMKHNGQDVLFVFPSPIPLFSFIGRVGIVGSVFFIIFPFFLPLIHAGLISPTTSGMGKPDHLWLMLRFGCFIVLWNSLTFISLGSAVNYLVALTFLALIAAVAAGVLVACYGRDLIDEKLASICDAFRRSLRRGPSRQSSRGVSSIKCGGCGSDNAVDFQIVRDKNNNQGFLCPSCRREYASLLTLGSIRRFWMCGACGYRILAGTRIDDAVGQDSRCPNCGADVNSMLVNLNNDRPVASGQFGQPLG